MKTCEARMAISGEPLHGKRHSATTINPAASQRCTNAGGVASVDKRSTQLGLHCNGLVNHDTCIAGVHSPVT